MKKALSVLVLVGLASAATLSAQTLQLGPGFSGQMALAGPGPAGPGGPGGPGPQGPPPDQVLKDVLGFTQAQLDSLQQLLQTRGTAIEALMKQLPAAEKALADAAGAATPDPTKVGSAFLAVQAIHKQIGQANEAFKTGFNNLLTADQQAKVAAIKALQASLTAGGVLGQMGL